MPTRCQRPRAAQADERRAPSRSRSKLWTDSNRPSGSNAMCSRWPIATDSTTTLGRSVVSNSHQSGLLSSANMRWSASLSRPRSGWWPPESNVGVQRGQSQRPIIPQPDHLGHLARPAATPKFVRRLVKHAETCTYLCQNSAAVAIISVIEQPLAPSPLRLRHVYGGHDLRIATGRTLLAIR